MNAATKIELPGIEKFKSGKVREVYDLGDQYLFIASDRISAFDCIMPNGIPNKGQVLNMISKFWFDRTGDVVKNHMISTDVNDFPAELQEHAELLKGRSMLVTKAELLPVECIVRGYLIGSGWKEYQKSRTIGGMPLRAGYEMAGKLDEPIFTPSTKAEIGDVGEIVHGQLTWPAPGIGFDLGAPLPFRSPPNRWPAVASASALPGVSPTR